MCGFRLCRLPFIPLSIQLNWNSDCLMYAQHMVENVGNIKCYLILAIVLTYWWQIILKCKFAFALSALREYQGHKWLLKTATTHFTHQIPSTIWLHLNLIPSAHHAPHKFLSPATCAAPLPSTFNNGSHPFPPSGSNQDLGTLYWQFHFPWRCGWSHWVPREICYRLHH